VAQSPKIGECMMGPQLIHSLQYFKFKFKKGESGTSWQRHSAMPTGTFTMLEVCSERRVQVFKCSSVQEHKWILMEHKYDRIEVDLKLVIRCF
jgi:hypothetical protein